MPGRGTRGRTRGSWAARLTGIGAVMLLACAGSAAYLLTSSARTAGNRTGLTTRVLGTQTIALVSWGPPDGPGHGHTAAALAASAAHPAFIASAQVRADWTADRMADGSYMFISIPGGRCLTATAPPSAPSVGLGRCQLSAGSQRWVQQRDRVNSGGREFWELRNLADGRCLTASGPDHGAHTRFAAVLRACATVPAWPQLVAFWVSY